MSKVQPQVTTRSVNEPATTPTQKHSRTDNSFDELLGRSRELASRLSIHKAAEKLSSLGSKSALKELAPSGESNENSETSDMRPIGETGDSIATLIGRLQLLHASRK